MRHQTSDRSGDPGPPVDEVRIVLQPRVSLDEIQGDWVTVAELSSWTGLSKNAAYEICRQEPLRGLVVRFGRQIRIPKAALARLMDGES